MGVIKAVRTRTARKNSTCGQCGLPIRVGDPIASVGTERPGTWVHRDHLIEDRPSLLAGTS